MRGSEREHPNLLLLLQKTRKDFLYLLRLRQRIGEVHRGLRLFRHLRFALSTLRWTPPSSAMSGRRYVVRFLTRLRLRPTRRFCGSGRRFITSSGRTPVSSGPINGLDALEAAKP